jgi:hypothetical protein
VLISVDTEEAHEKLINSRLAYVAVSRARYDAQIFTNNAEHLGEALSRDVSKDSAIELEQPEALDMARAAAVSQAYDPGHSLDQDLGIEQ